MIITVGHLKGGVGKTTIAMNLAIDFQKRGYAPVVIDADPTLGSAQLWSNDRDSEGLPPIPVAEEDRNVMRTMREAQAQYQDVILDLPAGRSQHMDSGLMLSDVLVVPTSGQHADLESLEMLSSQLEDAQRLNPDLTVIIVLNRLTRQATREEISQAEHYLRSFPGFELSENAFVVDESWNRARAAGKGVVEIDCETSATMRSLSLEVISAGERSPARFSAGTLG